MGTVNDHLFRLYARSYKLGWFGKQVKESALDLLSDLLMRFQFRGTLYFRTSFTSPWGVDVPYFPDVMRFHFAHKGRCFARVDGVKTPVSIEQGDLLIIPRGARHRLYCDPVNEHAVLPLDTVLEKSGFSGKGALVYGGDDDDRDTQLICGHFAFDPQMRHPIIDQLPPFLHIPNYGEGAGKWMESTLRMIGAEAGHSLLGGDLIAVKMSEIIFAQALRAFILTNGHEHTGLAGFADPQISKALHAAHGAPQNNWTVAELAHVAGMSRTAFSNRFTALMGITPMGYLTSWRIQLARQELSGGKLSVAEVGARIGYASEAAFSRIFKKISGTSPAAYRRMMQ